MMTKLSEQDIPDEWIEKVRRIADAGVHGSCISGFRLGVQYAEAEGLTKAEKKTYGESLQQLADILSNDRVILSEKDVTDWSEDTIHYLVCTGVLKPISNDNCRDATIGRRWAINYIDRMGGRWPVEKIEKEAKKSITFESDDWNLCDRQRDAIRRFSQRIHLQEIDLLTIAKQVQGNLALVLAIGIIAENLANIQRSIEMFISVPPEESDTQAADKLVSYVCTPCGKTITVDCKKDVASVACSECGQSIWVRLPFCV